MTVRQNKNSNTIKVPVQPLRNDKKRKRKGRKLKCSIKPREKKSNTIVPILVPWNLLQDTGLQTGAKSGCF